ncbi:Embryonic polarity protein dorsal [Frankliniella fusca]|uniref:Embryonic polarity protein dorsal n=1 Tax=Frankliniella fusca TaxID=407009 RepID=A0AAE1LLM9_9NEOP|nr:Embryonic polarity protein dorsal [Frankliniella fusca]
MDHLDGQVPGTSVMEDDTAGSLHISDVIDVIQMDETHGANTTGNMSESGDRRRLSSETARIVILEQPASKALRFRYECEGRSAGSIPGVNSTPENKTYPTIQVLGYKGRAAVIVSCVTKDPPYRPHPHNLVGKEGCKRGVFSQHVSSNNMIVSFSNLGIQCVKKKDIEEALRGREEIRVDPFRTGFAHRNHPTGIDLNAVRLCFQVFLEGPEPNTYTRALAPVVSEPIYDKKAMSDLVICKLSEASAPVAGGKEMILLCEKVAKEDIQIRFYEERENHVQWEAYADFQPSQVHKQVAISFRTPKYERLEVDRPVDVFIQLKRPSDGATSEALPFQMLPLDSGRPSFWRLGGALGKNRNFSMFSQILGADPGVASKPTGVLAPPSMVPAQPTPEVVDLSLAEQVQVPVASPDMPMEENKPPMAQMVVTSELLIAPATQSNDAIVNMRQNIEEADYAEVHKWQKISCPVENTNMSIISGMMNNEAEETQALNELIKQVGAELDEFYADSKSRGLAENDLCPIKMDLPDLQDIDDFQDMYDDTSYSSLQLAMKNPVELMDSYEQALSTLPPSTPVLLHTPCSTPSKRESPEKVPPLPPKRAKKAPHELLPPPLPPCKPIPPPPSEIRSPKSPKSTFFSKLFSKKSSPEKKKNVKGSNLSRGSSMRSPTRPTVEAKNNIGASMGNLSRFRDGEDSIFISLRGSLERDVPAVTQPTMSVADQENNNILLNDVNDVLSGLTETEQLDLYTDMAPRATVSEFDEMSSYYSPVEGGRILMPERGKMALNTQGV